MAKNWIAGAIKHKGSFRKAAEEHGEGTEEYAHNVLKPGSKASSTTKHRAELAETLIHMSHKKKSKPKIDKLGRK